MEAVEAVDALGALAQETRLAAYRLLVEAGPQGLAAGSVAERLGVPANTLSFHLSHLSRAGLVTQRRLGRRIVYAADFARMNALVGFLTSNCCGGTLQVTVCDPGAPARGAECAPGAACAPARTA